MATSSSPRKPAKETALKYKADEETIKNKTSLSGVMGRYFNVHEINSAQYRCRCPYHEDYDPSMLINEDKGYYYCFACGHHGDVLTFLCDLSGQSRLKVRNKCIHLLETEGTIFR